MCASVASVPLRLVSLGAALALIAALAGAIVSACYDVPRPACGFLCGPAGECPDGYTCAAEQVCHANGSPDGLVCRNPDAALPVDAMPDAASDAMPDGMVDAADDAMVDAMVDAADDAALDVDAEVDAPP